MGQDLVKISLVNYALVVHNLAKTIGNKECKEEEIVLFCCHDNHFPWEKIKADTSFDGMYGDVTFAVLE